MQLRKSGKHRRYRQRHRPLAERLEPCLLLSGTFFVKSSGDAFGQPNLRAAINSAEMAGGGTIDFDILTSPLTIDLTSPLPAITIPVVIDGTTQPGYSTTPL